MTFFKSSPRLMLDRFYISRHRQQDLYSDIHSSAHEIAHIRTHTHIYSHTRHLCTPEFTLEQIVTSTKNHICGVPTCSLMHGIVMRI